MKVYILKTSHGVELIAKVELEKNTTSPFMQTLTLTDPMQFASMGDENGSPRIGFFPYYVSDNEGKIKMNGRLLESYIKEEHITNQALVKEYLTRTSSIELL